MTGRPHIWRSATARAHDTAKRRQRDLAAMRRLADQYDARQAAKAQTEPKEQSK